MKKFNFRFENVKKIREYEAEIAKEILDNAIFNRVKCEEGIEKLENEIEYHIDQLSDLTAKEKLEIHMIMNLRNFIAVKRLEKAREEKKLLKFREIEDEKRNEFIEKKKELKKIEILEDRDKKKYKKEFLRNENKLLDEIGNRNF